MTSSSSEPSAIEQPPPSPVLSPSPMSRLRPIFRIFGIVFLLLCIFLTYKIVRVGLYGWSIYRNGSALLQLAESDNTRNHLLAAYTPLVILSQAAQGIEQEMRWFAPVLRSARGLPGYGPTLAAAPDLLEGGSALAGLALAGLDVIQPALVNGDDAPMAQILAKSLAGDEERLASMVNQAKMAQQSFARATSSQLHPLLSGQVAKLQSLISLLTVGLEMAPALPRLLGVERPQTYLLLVQNNHELRATGGFISGVGNLTVVNGAIDSIEFTDSYNIAREDVDHPWSPAPMQRYMGIDLLFLRDANWSPDLPTTAQMARALYAQDTGVMVDGIATVDLHAVELIVAGLGALHVPDASAPVTADTVIEQIKQFWNQPAAGLTAESEKFGEWWRQRKDFMPTIAQAAIERIQSGQLDYLNLIQHVQAALDERAIQIWVDEPLASGLLARAGWDGGLHPAPPADFLALVDTNMGYNKVDAVLKRSILYEVHWPNEPEKPAFASVTITYEHPIAAPGHVCDPTPRYGATYDDMFKRCYFDYVRLYVPAGSQLVSAEGVEPDSILSQRGEERTEIWAGYFVMAPGDQHVVVFTYWLPSSITPTSYSLVAQRQSGVGPLPFTAKVAAHSISSTLAAGRFVWSPE